MVHKDDSVQSPADGIPNGLTTESNGVPCKLKSGVESNNGSDCNIDSPPVNGNSGSGTNSPSPVRDKSEDMDSEITSKNGDSSVLNGNEQKETSLSLSCEANPDDDLSRLDKSIIDFMENSSQNDGLDTNANTSLNASSDASRNLCESTSLPESSDKNKDAEKGDQESLKNGSRPESPMEDEKGRSEPVVVEDASADAISLSGESSQSHDAGTPHSKSQSVSPAPSHDVDSTVHSKKEESSNVEYIENSPTTTSKVGSMLGVTQTPSVASDGMRPMAKLLFEMGLDMVRQNVYKDLIKIQTKKNNQDKLGEKEGKQLSKLKEAFDHLITKNEPFVLDYNKTCSDCGLTADLDSVIDLHLEYSHQSQPNRYKCSYCVFETLMPGAFFYHMEAEHNKKGRIHAPLANYTCSFCSFESNQKNHFLKHIIKCQKQFNISRNLEPSPADCDIPLKLAGKESPAASVDANRKGGKTAGSSLPINVRPNSAISQAKGVSSAAMTNVPTPQIVSAGASGAIPGAPQRIVQMGGQFYSLVYQGSQAFLTPISSAAMGASMQQVIAAPAKGQPPIAGMNVTQIHPQQSIQQLAQKTVETVLANAARTNQTQAVQVTPAKPASANKTGDSQFEICEICGGFVKDRETLRIHFLWSHKVDLHPAVLQRSQPSLSCKECPERFWTHQGMQRHSGMAHSKSTASTGGLKANAAMKCPMHSCSGSQITDMVSHFHLTHSTLCNALIPRKKCIICFSDCHTLFKLEQHMTSVHAEYINSLFALGRLFQLYCPKGAEQYKKDKMAHDGPEPTGNGAKLMNANSTQRIISCTRCSSKLHGLEATKKHFYGEHGHLQESCLLCNENLPIGYPLVTHIQIKHCKALKVKMQRLPKGVTEKYSVPETVPAAKKAKATSRKRTGKRKRPSGGEGTNDVVQDPAESPPLKKSRTVMVAGDPVDIIEEVEDENSNAPARQAPSSDKVPDKKTIEEVMEIDGETVIVQEQVDDDDDEEEECEDKNV